MDDDMLVLDEGASDPRPIKIKDLVAGKKVVFFGLPGAYTSVCSSKHVPQYNERLEKLKEAGVDTVACLSVNGLLQHIPGLGVRSMRYSLMADDGVVKILNVEEPGGKSYKVSGPDNMLKCISELKG
ncbi:Peroxiredoxin-2F [Monoraphidium neglectum]|uniref:glutaredoxin-dependent peroxiredoxin n=1 Tax=Monoraphidium neglectum TaxID=145388 RepID=A0A0D2M0K2_9CHLO|nr:Peroxiredoxin-2F [Monoraphidium neglectum]KIY95036.1 Peroxiredoxin-2F [Monoraphidium neglectum]|eukprot:XP_013894056.1 Peroxiredoxin-2F [Monoraphidium neglectum]